MLIHRYAELKSNGMVYFQNRQLLHALSILWILKNIVVNQHHEYRVFGLLTVLLAEKSSSD